jgi:hypothetical protein
MGKSQFSLVPRRGTRGKGSEKGGKDGRTGGDTLISMQPNEITDPQILPTLLNPSRLVRVLPMHTTKMRQMRAMKVRSRLLLLVRFSRSVRWSRRSSINVVGVEIAFFAEVTCGEGSFVRDAAGGVGSATAGGGGGSGRAVAGGSAFFASGLEGSSARSGTREFGLSLPRPTGVGENLLLVVLVRRLTQRDALLPLPIGLGRRTELLRSPKALLLAVFALFGFVLGVAEELAAEEDVADEGGKAEVAGFAKGEVGVVVAAAEGEDL